MYKVTIVEKERTINVTGFVTISRISAKFLIFADFQTFIFPQLFLIMK